MASDMNRRSFLRFLPAVSAAVMTGCAGTEAASQDMSSGLEPIRAGTMYHMDCYSGMSSYYDDNPSGENGLLEEAIHGMRRDFEEATGIRFDGVEAVPREEHVPLEGLDSLVVGTYGSFGATPYKAHLGVPNKPSEADNMRDFRTVTQLSYDSVAVNAHVINVAVENLNEDFVWDQSDQRKNRPDILANILRHEYAHFFGATHQTSVLNPSQISDSSQLRINPVPKMRRYAQDITPNTPSSTVLETRRRYLEQES